MSVFVLEAQGHQSHVRTACILSEGLLPTPVIMTWHVTWQECENTWAGCKQGNMDVECRGVCLLVFEECKNPQQLF